MRKTSPLTPHASRLTITHHASRITHHASRLTPHASRLTPHASRTLHRAKTHLFQLLRIIGQGHFGHSFKVGQPVVQFV